MNIDSFPHSPEADEARRRGEELARLAMQGATNATELPSDDIRRNHPSARISDGALPETDQGVLPKTKEAKFSSKDLKRPLTADELAAMNAARRDANARMPQHPPISRY